MTVHKFPQEMLPQNRSWLNRQCKNALGQLKVGANPSVPYCVQLADLALEREWYRPMGQELELTIHGMYGWKPESVRRFFEIDEAGDEIDITSGPGMSPEDLAAKILDHVESKLSEPTGSTYPTLWKGHQLRDDD